MYETIPEPLRNLARSEPLLERSRQMFTVPTEIPKATVDAMPLADRQFLTQSASPAPPAPAPATLYTLSGQTYILNGRVSDLTVQQKNGVLLRLKVANGIRMIRVSVDTPNDVATLETHFFNVNFLAEIVTKYNANNSSARKLFPIAGGLRLRAGEAVGQVQVDSSNAPTIPAISQPDANQPILVLQVKRIGDYSTYTLGVSAAVISAAAIFDPLFAELDFKFRPGCFNANCAPEWEVAPAPLPEPSIDYLAKDYESFRLTMISAMMERVPDWQATSEADLDVALLELFSAAADELSDYQDRVMNEAFLASCRKRVSLARHSRLMDYHIHQGNQASTRLALEIEHDTGIQKQFEIFENLKIWAGESKLVSGKKKEVESSVVFHSRNTESQTVHQLLNSIGLYTWSDSIPNLRAGSTRADLKLYGKIYLGDPVLTPDATEVSAKKVRDLIRNGRVEHLLIQEHINPTSGALAGRDPSKRQLLKLIADGAEALLDPITNEWLLRVRWEKNDALQRDYCFTIDCPAPIGKVENVSLFHGNLIEVFHGRRQTTIFKEPNVNLIIDPNKPLEFYYRRSRWGAICRLPEKSLAYQNTPAGGDFPTFSTLKIEVEEFGGGKDLWDEVPSLIHSDESDENGDHFVVETDENRQSYIRFGNGINGKELSDGAIVTCEYQFGEPLEGNIGAEMLVSFDIDSIDSAPVGLQIRSCWNPFDVTDGLDREPVAEIIRRVPEAYRARQLRAVTLADYIARAEEITGVSRAAARYAWTGSWRTVRVTIDPIGTNELSDELRKEVFNYLEAVRLIGEDLEIRPPKFVPLEIKVALCAAPDVWIEDIKFVLEEEFSVGWTPDGRRGFFHPDLWTFGQTLYASQIIGRVMQVRGVEHIISVEIKRRNSPLAATDSFTKVAYNEIIEVLSDADQLERGSITFDVKGGRQ
jgi:hypothetical protein